jgi:tetratricopeptide (TPR) repeat protein
MNPFLLRKNLFFFPLVFALWATILFLRYADHRYLDLPFPSVGSEEFSKGAGRVALLQESIAELMKALGREKNGAEAPHLLQNISNDLYELYKATGDRLLLDSALVYAKRSIAGDPTIARFHYNLGRFYTEVGDQRQAIEEYIRTIQYDPRHILALSNAGTCAYFAFGARSESADFLHRALAIDSLMPMCHAILGLIDIDNKDYSAARDDFEKELDADGSAIAVQRYPISPQNIATAAMISHDNLMGIYSKEFKNRDRALFHFSEYCKLEPDKERRVMVEGEMRKYWGDLQK